ncbi:MAG: DUF488 family protein [Methylococcales bacterium]|nr:DUF488 family protein [Methylococcales bacterium]
MKLTLKRVYEPTTVTDGTRILVDRLWPRGLAKAEARIDFWAKEAAPSTELRRWYQHEREKWPEFQRKYLAELQENPEAVQKLIAIIGNKNATLLFSSKENLLNNAAVLKSYLEGLS